MRRFSTNFIFFLLAAASAGCANHLNSTPTAVDDQVRFAQLAKLGDMAPSSVRAGEEELHALAGKLEGIASIEIGSIESGREGAVARDVTINFKGGENAGLHIDELRAWGVGAGADASGDVPIAERLDARGISSYGLETLLEEQVRAYNAVLKARAKGPAPAGEKIEQSLVYQIERYSIAADSLVVDGLTLHRKDDAVARDTMEESSGNTALAGLIKSIKDGIQPISFDASIMNGISMDIKMKQPMAASDMKMTAVTAVAEGWRLGDLDFGAVKDITSDMKMVAGMASADDVAVNEDQPVQQITMQMGSAYDLFSIEGVKLAKLYSYLAEGALPPVSDTNLMSLGVWRIHNQHDMFGGREIVSVKAATVDLSRFHWLIPMDIRVSAEGGKYNMGALFAYVQEMAAVNGGAEAAEQTQIEQFIAAMQTSGLDTIAYEFDASGAWNPDNGVTHSRMDISADEIGDWKQSFDGVLPNYEVVTQILPTAGEAFDWEEAASKLLRALAFDHGLLVLTDRGVVEKGFTMAVEMAKLAPADDPNAAMMRNADPADLRASSAAMIRLTAPQAAQSFPPAAGYLTALADFIQNGGVLRIEAAPLKPLTLELWQSEVAAMQSDPNRAAELLGLTVVHEETPTDDK